MNNGNPFFDHPILNSPYGYPERHWELDDQGQPTQKIVEHRRPAEFITPIPKPKKRKAKQTTLVFDEGLGFSTASQQYNHTAIINSVRNQVDKWRRLPNSNDWRVTPETARLLQHWRHHNFSGIRPFFCQVEAIETAIWLTEVAPQSGKAAEGFLEHLANANNDANPELMRLALKLATGAGLGPLSRRSRGVHLPVSSSTSSAFPRTLSRSPSRVSPWQGRQPAQCVSPANRADGFIQIKPSRNGVEHSLDRLATRAPQCNSHTVNTRHRSCWSLARKGFRYANKFALETLSSAVPVRSCPSSLPVSFISCASGTSITWEPAASRRRPDFSSRPFRAVLFRGCSTSCPSR